MRDATLPREIKVEGEPALRHTAGTILDRWRIVPLIGKRWEYWVAFATAILEADRQWREGKGKE